jgi:hypothetical protein
MRQGERREVRDCVVYSVSGEADAKYGSRTGGDGVLDTQFKVRRILVAWKMLAWYCVFHQPLLEVVRE